MLGQLRTFADGSESISSIERRTRGSPFNVGRQGAGPISFDMDFPVFTQRAIPMD
jgi:hypothetical protein